MKSRALTSGNVKGNVGASTKDEIMDLLHHENIKLPAPKEMMKSSGDCQVINQSLIDG